MTASTAVAAAPSAWRSRSLLAATALSVTGDGMFTTAAALLAAAITHSPVVISLVTAVMFGTRIIFQIPAGALADSWPRRRVMVTADLARMGLLLVLAALAAVHEATVPILLTAVAAVTAVSCFFSPASQAVIPEILGEDKQALDKFNARYWMVYAAGQIAGPPLGAVAFTAASALPFLSDAFSFAGSAALLRHLPPSRAPAREQRPKVTDGLRYLRGTRALRIITAGIAGDNFASACVLGIFVLYCRETLHLPVYAYGLLLAASAPAAVAASLKPDLLASRMGGQQIVAICALAQGAGWVLVAIFPSVWAVTLEMLILGASAVWAGGAISTAFQTNTPGNLRGSAWAASLTFGVGAAGLGALTGGLVANAAGLNAAVILAAITAVITGAVILKQE